MLIRYKNVRFRSIGTTSDFGTKFAQKYMNDKTFEKINEEDEEIRKAFESKPMISYRKSRKLKIYLVQTESYPISRTVGCYKSGSKRCEVCKHIIETVTFTSTVTRETFKINHHFDCNDEYLVYLMTCNKCKKQYTSQTTDPCHSRWNNCKSKGRSFDKEEQCKQENLYKQI